MTDNSSASGDISSIICTECFLEYTSDAAEGIGNDQRYDVIAVTGSLPLLQQQFQKNLEVGGRLFIITGSLPIMEANLITRVDENNWSGECLLETCIPPLLHATRPQAFIF